MRRDTPDARPVTTETASANAKTAASIAISSARGVKRAVKATSRSRTSQATSSPSRRRRRASIVLSVSSWRAIRRGPAPSAARTASSRSRPSTRASVRFATLAATSSSTKPVVGEQHQQRRARAPRQLVAHRQRRGPETGARRVVRRRGTAATSRRETDVEVALRLLERRARAQPADCGQHPRVRGWRSFPGSTGTGQADGGM